jgi:hypothetical protein
MVWSIVLLEKLVVAELVKKFPCPIGKPKVHYCVHKLSRETVGLKRAKKTSGIDPVAVQLKVT